MTSRTLTPVLLLGLALGFMPAKAAPLPDATDSSRIARLIEQLGSADFETREKATRDLDALGAAALEALKKAATSDDPEVRRRAEDLVGKVERKAQSEKALAPQKVRLVLKDVPVPEAVALLKKESGFDVVLADSDGKLKERKVTLDTGETTFWQALDRLCVAAGLVEGNAAQQAIFPGRPINAPGPAVLPLPPRPVQIAPGRPVQIEAPAVPPPPPPPPLPAPAAKPRLVPPAPPQAPQAAQPAPLQTEKVVPPPPAAQAAAPPVAQPLPNPIRPVKPLPPVWLQPPPGFGGQPSQITLVDGKPKELPTAYVGALRVRAMPRDIVPVAAADDLHVNLQASLEPRLNGQDVFRVHIDKAVDDQGQQLTPAVNDGAGQIVPAQGIFVRPAIARFPMPVVNQGMHQNLSVTLRGGEKPSKLLKQLTGTISGTIAQAPKDLIVADNVAKAAGKTFKGVEGGSIKINQVSKDNLGRLQVSFEMELPPGVQDRGNGGFGVVPLPAVPVPLPPGAPLPRQALPVPGAFQAQAQIQIQVGGGAWIGGVGFANGVTALDDKGNVLHPVGTRTTIRQDATGLHREMMLTFAVGVEPAKLVYKNSKPVAFEAAFTLKNVPLQ